MLKVNHVCTHHDQLLICAKIKWFWFWRSTYRLSEDLILKQSWMSCLHCCISVHRTHSWGRKWSVITVSGVTQEKTGSSFRFSFSFAHYEKGPNENAFCTSRRKYREMKPGILETSHLYLWIWSSNVFSAKAAENVPEHSENMVYKNI